MPAPRFPTRWLLTAARKTQGRLIHAPWANDLSLVAKKVEVQVVAMEVVDALRQTSLVVDAAKVRVWSASDLVMIQIDSCNAQSQDGWVLGLHVGAAGYKLRTTAAPDHRSSEGLLGTASGVDCAACALMRAWIRWEAGVTPVLMSRVWPTLRDDPKDLSWTGTSDLGSSARHDCSAMLHQSPASGSQALARLDGARHPLCLSPGSVPSLADVQ